MAETDQWEYRVMTFGSLMRNPKDEELAAILNQWGEEGWEVISASPVESTYKVRIVAKRPLTASTRRRRTLSE